MLTQETLVYLTELRRRLLYCVYSYLILFCLFFYAADSLFNFLAIPLLKFLPEQSTLVATQITSPVIMPIKLALNLAFFCNLPIIFYQIWLFITPALYKQEKQYIFPLVLISLILFLTGVFFAYYFILPMMFSFFVQWLPADVKIMADINNYLEFIFKMFLIFGLVFEIPLIIIILIKLRLITAQQLTNFRSYFILLAFVLAMFLTPPDVLSMILLAVPICLLYELGILIAKLPLRNYHRSCDPGHSTAKSRNLL